MIFLNTSIFITVIFAVFDGVRDTFLEGSPISYIKEFIVFQIYLIILVTTRKKSFFGNKYLVIFNAGCLLFIAITASTTYAYGQAGLNRSHGLSFGGWSVWIKLVVFMVMVNMLTRLRHSYPNIYFNIPKTYIYLTIAYSLLTMLFIGTGLANSLPQRNWSGRLAIGYPTMDSLIFVMGCLYAQFFLENRFKNALVQIVFFILLIMQNTASGYLMYISYLLAMIYYGTGRWKLLPVFVMAGMAFCLFLVYMYFSEFGAFGALIQDKINGFIFGGDTSSIQIRQLQIIDFNNAMHGDMMALLFGKGGGGAFLVESQYYSIIGMTGLIGLTLYSIFLFSFFLIGRRNSLQPMIYSTIIIYSIGSMSLTGFYLYPFIFILAHVTSMIAISDDSGSKFKSMCR